MRMRSLVAVLVFVMLAGACPASTDDATLGPNDWLLRAEGEEARMRLLQQDLAGFSRTMWEIGERWRHLHQALLDGNFKLAEHHWEETMEAIRHGMIRRPLRAPNANQLFLAKAWPALGVALKAADSTKSWRAFEAARGACLACHIAEDVAFFNDQPLFRDLRAPGAE